MNLPHLTPLPRPLGRALPLATLVAPLPPRAVLEPLVDGAMLDRLVIVVPGVPWLPTVFLLGVAVMLDLPTKLESVVINVVSASDLVAVPLCKLIDASCASRCLCCFWKRLIESAIGASGKSTTNAFMLRP